MSETPKILIIAGPNGAGKTTFALEFLPHEANCLTFVNADLIAAGLSPFQPETAALRAGRIMLEEIKTHVSHGTSFALETTLSGITYTRMIPSWRAAGYRVKLVFLALASPEEAIARVAMRVRQGGHFIPDETVRRRFHAGMKNFQTIYCQRVDYWQWYDNSGEIPRLINEGANP